MPDAYLDAMDVGESTELWAKVLSMAPGKMIAVYVAETSDGVIGFASGNLLAEAKFGLDAELGAVYLMPHAQRSGIGRRLVAMVANTLAARGANGLIAWVITENKPARQFFAQLGAQLLIEQAYTWEGDDLIEAGYAWRDLAALAQACGE
ncbi:MAG: GNAT family N-acetyltransferase [Herminiimonas sp.]|nr:GNAT family N-acetyltransferase [Herminiimonas sp.]